MTLSGSNISLQDRGKIFTNAALTLLPPPSCSLLPHKNSHMYRQSRRVILSSDNVSPLNTATINIDKLPPSDPPSDSSDMDVDFNQTSDDIPLITRLRQAQQESPVDPESHSHKNYHSEDPITPSPPRTRPRSSSVPKTPSKVYNTVHHAPRNSSPSKISSDIIDLTPRRQRQANYTAGQVKCSLTLARKREESRAEQEKQREKQVNNVNIAECREQLQQEEFFDELLNKMKEKGYTLAHLLDYVFNLKNRHSHDW